MQALTQGLLFLAPRLKTSVLPNTTPFPSPFFLDGIPIRLAEWKTGVLLNATPFTSPFKKNRALLIRPTERKMDFYRTDPESCDTMVCTRRHWQTLCKLYQCNFIVETACFLDIHPKKVLVEADMSQRWPDRDGKKSLWRFRVYSSPANNSRCISLSHRNTNTLPVTEQDNHPPCR